MAVYDHPVSPVPEETTAYCLECGYVLRGLPDQRCPECGRDFDPAQPDTYTTTPRPTRTVPFGLALAVAVYPVVPIGLILATWVSARAALGHALRPELDDPTTIAGATRFLFDAAQVAFIGLLFYIPIVPLVLIAYLLFGRDANRARRTLLLLTVYALLFGGSCLGARTDMAASILPQFFD